MKIRRDKLDILFSEYIRRRAIKLVGGCERCLTLKYDTLKEDGSIFPAWKKLQCAHFDGRSKKSVRWDEDNACACCYGCHQYLDSHPLEKVEFFKHRLGEERFEFLRGRMRITYPKPDKRLIELYLKTKLLEVSNGYRKHL